MQSFSFDMENHACAQKVINESSASGACLFLFNKLYQNERAISFIYHRKTPEAAIGIYRKSLFLVYANLPHLSPGNPE